MKLPWRAVPLAPAAVAGRPPGFSLEPISKFAWAWQRRFSRLTRRVRWREYLKGISPARPTPAGTKSALFQWNAAAHLAERRSASGDIAFGYASRLHALLCQRDARTMLHANFEIGSMQHHLEGDRPCRRTPQHPVRVQILPCCNSGGLIGKGTGKYRTGKIKERR